MTTTPIINLNGTSAEALLDQQIKVLEAARGLFQAQADATPNGRDYPGRPDLHRAAMAEHRERLAAVQKIQREAEVIGAAAADHVP